MSDKLRKKGKYWTHGVEIVTGCTRVSPGCDRCWSLEKDRRFFKTKFKPRFYPGDIARLRTTARMKPRVFSLWNDLFHEAVKDDQIQSTYEMMALYPKNTYLILTKRPERAREFFLACKSFAQYESPRCSNLWLGVSAENQQYVDQRIPLLLETPSARRFVSLEPMLGQINIPWTWLRHPYDMADGANSARHRIHWVIVGCETGPGRRPCDLEWIEAVIENCHNRDVPVWVKSVNVDGKVVSDFDRLPESVRVREMPE